MIFQIPTIAFADDLSEEKRLSAIYLEQMSKEPGAQVIASGIVLRPIFVSEAQPQPDPNSIVKVTYHLTDREGKLIEENYSADELAEFPLNKLIACWKIAIPQMHITSLYKISCPSDTAYGDKGIPGVIKGGAALTFRVTVFGFSAP
jgi:FKBP-type peptidyl-prolyl cis-trans isomerase FkpA